MVICRYFQQGNCRFGNACRNEHTYDNRYNYVSGNANTTAFRPQPQSQSSTNTQNDIATIVRAITVDMAGSEKGNQWLLTCYGPLKDKPNFPGFADQSFEEVRLGMYEAQKQGTVDQYIQQFNGAKEAAKQKFQSCQTATNDLINIVKNLYTSNQGSSNVFATSTASTNLVFNTKSPTEFYNSNNPLYGNNQSSAIFGAKPAIQNSIFNQQPAAVTGGSIFGGSSTSFNTTPTNNVFAASGGAQGPSNSSQSIFATQSNVFGGSVQQSTSIFGSASQQPNSFSSPNIFGNTTQQGSIFSNSQSNANVFQSQHAESPVSSNLFSNSQSNAFGSPQNMFIGSTVQPTGDVFANSPNKSIFQTAQSEPNIFGSVQMSSPSNVFGSNQTNIFATANVSGSIPNDNFENNIHKFAPAVSNSSNIFMGNPTNTFGAGEFMNTSPNPNVFGQSPMFNGGNSTVFSNTIGNSPVDKSNLTQFYSKLEDLSQSDINAFNSESFEFGAIPELPPTIELCQ